MFGRPPRVSDCTLRDGEQQAGVVFSRADKVELAKLLDQVGVPDLEAGTPAVSDDDRLALEDIAALGLRARVSALARAIPADVDLVSRCGAQGVRISFPISPRQLTAKLHLTPDEYLRQSLSITSYAKERGLEVIFSPYDTTRCDLNLLERVLVAFRREGCVDRVRLVDTTGAATPQAVHFLVKFMTEASGGIPIEVHFHDDFGLAVANTVAGAIAGAAYLSATVNGIGERSGNSALEEVVMALTVLYGLDLGIRTERLASLSAEVEKRSGVDLQPHKAVVGRNSFRHETGMVVAGLLNDPFTAEAYRPKMVGQTRSIVLGKKSGRASIEYKLRQLGVEATPELVGKLLADVKGEALARGRALTDDEFAAIVAGATDGPVASR